MSDVMTWISNWTFLPFEQSCGANLKLLASHSFCLPGRRGTTIGCARTPCGTKRKEMALAVSRSNWNVSAVSALAELQGIPPPLPPGGRQRMTTVGFFFADDGLGTESSALHSWA